MNNALVHSLILVITLFLGFLIPKTNLVNYDLQITAFLFIILYLGKKIIPQKTNLLESVILTLIVILIVNSTGGALSPFFFLIYFLLFSLSLLLEPIISLVVSLTLIILFLFHQPAGENFKELLPIFSLAFLTPFSLYLGKEYLLLQKTKTKMGRLKEDTFLFLSLILKNHLKNIKENLENFSGDHQLEAIKKSVQRMEKLIDKFEKRS